MRDRAAMAGARFDAIVSSRASLRRKLSMGSLSPVHWIIVLVVVLLLFGPRGLAGVGKGLGHGLRSFKKALNEDPSPEAEAKEPPTPDKSDRPHTERS
jgi:sec-independent protein translocase protein TatA